MPTAKLKGSKFYTESDFEAFTDSFDKGLKINFSEGTRKQFVKFGSLRDNDSQHDVKGGQLMLNGSVNFYIYNPTNATVSYHHNHHRYPQNSGCQVFSAIRQCRA
jgi:hypothetical protein